MGMVEMNFRNRSSKVSLREVKMLGKREESRMNSMVLYSKLEIVMPFPKMEEKREDPEAYGICFCFNNEGDTPGIPEFCVFHNI